MNFDWLSNGVKEVIVTASLGASMGTLWRAVTRPETVAMRFVAQAVISLTVGTVIGGAIIQFFKFDGFVAAGVGATVAYLAEEVLRFMAKRGEKLEKGVIDTSLMGEDNE